jgi:hypothetical protein
MTQDDRKDFKKWIVDLVYESSMGLCPRCGASLEDEPFHHKDGNHANNTLDNCELLCIKCHHSTYGEDNAYSKHKSQEALTLETLNAVMKNASDPNTKVSGAVLEKLLEGLSLGLKVSRQSTGLDYGMMRTPASINIERGYAESKALGDAYSTGYMEGVKATVSKLGVKTEG